MEITINFDSKTIFLTGTTELNDLLDKLEKLKTILNDDYVNFIILFKNKEKSIPIKIDIFPKKETIVPDPVYPLVPMYPTVPMYPMYPNTPPMC